MIKNGLQLLAALAVLGCDRDRAEVSPESFQGVAELHETHLSFEVGGRITEIRVREGARVKAGDVVATIDRSLGAQALAARELEARTAEVQATLVEKGARPEAISALRARIRAAKAAEDLLKRQAERERVLHERGVTPEARLDELVASHERAVAERQALESQLTELVRGARTEEREVARTRAEAVRASAVLDELRVDKGELTAPADGVVLDVHAEPGEVAAQGAPVLTIAAPRRLYADVFVPQAALSGIDVGDRATVRADGIGAALSGRVEHVARRTEFTPRFLFSERERPHLVVRVRVAIEDPEQRLHAGVPTFVGIDRGTPAAKDAR